LPVGTVVESDKSGIVEDVRNHLLQDIETITVTLPGAYGPVQEGL
jgi:hypothetical protein